MWESTNLLKNRKIAIKVIIAISLLCCNFCPIFSDSDPAHYLRYQGYWTHNIATGPVANCSRAYLLGGKSQLASHN